jgi:hypothetical protein
MELIGKSLEDKANSEALLMTPNFMENFITFEHDSPMTETFSQDKGNGQKIDAIDEYPPHLFLPSFSTPTEISNPNEGSQVYTPLNWRTKSSYSVLRHQHTYARYATITNTH